MRHFFIRLGKGLIFSRRHKSVRGGVLFLFSNLLVIGSVIFLIAIVLIFLGMDNFFIPLTHAISEFLSKVVFR
jgi:hypothetical protein